MACVKCSGKKQILKLALVSVHKHAHACIYACIYMCRYKSLLHNEETARTSVKLSGQIQPYSKPPNFRMGID